MNMIMMIVHIKMSLSESDSRFVSLREPESLVYDSLRMTHCVFHDLYVLLFTHATPNEEHNDRCQREQEDAENHVVV